MEKCAQCRKAGEKLFIANMSMVYPFDRGTNYAVELGNKAAQEICGD